MDFISTYQEESISNESYWRSIILFGRNVASYKFALAKSLIELSKANKDSISLEELAIPFSRNLCEHIQIAPKQTTSNSSRFLDSCISFNENRVSKDELISKTVQLGFNNVIDAFHTVNQGEIPIRFYHKDYSTTKRIILTDDFFKIAQDLSVNDLNNEVEARWNLVETAWELGINKNALEVYHDEEISRFFVLNKLHRKNVTSVRPTLNGYQKGKCFYCFCDISIDPKEEKFCDVDHFYPHLLKNRMRVDFNGVWNLVLACQNCNRGSEGKFARIPAEKYLKRLYKRNEFLICSHHPLKDTLMKQTGNYRLQRATFYREIDKSATNMLIHRWETPLKGPEIF